MNKNNSNSGKFLSMYNDFDKSMRKILNEDIRTSHSSLIKEMTRENYVFKKYEQDLISYANLRNAIVHNYREGDPYPIAEPHDDILEKYEELLNIINNPPLALKTIAIEAKDIYTTSMDTIALDVIKDMNKSTFTHVPVVENGKMIGIFSENTIVSYIASKEDVIIEKDVLIREFAEFIPINSHKSECFEFVSKGASIFDIEEKFQRELKDKKRLAVVFISETGNEKEKLLGLVTAWDLAGYDKYHN